MEFIWHDGGRAACGYVGLTGDCVTRAIAIATGTSYRDVYRRMGEISEVSPRNGVTTSAASDYLSELGFTYSRLGGPEFSEQWLPKGALVVHLSSKDSRRHGHFCSVIDHVLYDTWNPSDDDDCILQGYWTRPAVAGETTLPIVRHGRREDEEQTLTQKEFDKVLHLLKSLDNTANNAGSTDGEKRNALRMLQNLMLRHNLSREDITDDNNVENVRFTRMACCVNGRRACMWEKNLAGYLIAEIFPMSDWYFGVKGNRTLFWFYGPLDDVQNCLALFRELLLTIATSARLQYRGYSRGSGASYAEGYVAGLPRYQSSQGASTVENVVSSTALILARTLAVRKAAKGWLRFECGTSLVTERGNGRDQHDPDAADRGKEHGSKHDLSTANGRKRISASPIKSD